MSQNPKVIGIEFDEPLTEINSKIEELDSVIASITEKNQAEPLLNRLQQLKGRYEHLLKERYAHLTAWQKVLIARHPNRPGTRDYLTYMFEEFVPLHGDRCFKDDKSIDCGLAKLGRYHVLVLGHNKGKTTPERIECKFGMAHPEGYRKALRKMKLAEKLNLPVITLINTPGANPDIEAEERGQSQAIAENLFEMSRLRVPVICVVIGEGGSGGALGIGVGDKLLMLEHSYYSVISPEGCAAILWKSDSDEYKMQAANALKLKSADLKELGVVDRIIPEPIGGAHRNHHEMYANLKNTLIEEIKSLLPLSKNELLEKRYDKIRNYGYLHLWKNP